MNQDELSRLKELIGTNGLKVIRERIEKSCSEEFKKGYCKGLEDVIILHKEFKIIDYEPYD